MLLLVMNVWFLRAFNSSMGQYIGNGGALSTGQGSIFLWLFCALAFLKTAQKFDSYLAAMGLNVAQTGSGMGMELLLAARIISGVGSGARSAGSVFRQQSRYGTRRWLQVDLHPDSPVSSRATAMSVMQLLMVVSGWAAGGTVGS